MIYVCTLANSKEIVLAGKDIVTTKEELSRIVTDKTCTGLEFKEDFVDKYFTPSSLMAFIEEVMRLNPRIQVDVCKNYESKESSDMRMIEVLNDSEDFINWVFANKEASFRMFQRLCHEHNTRASEYLEANAKVSSLNLAYIENKNALEEEKAKSEYLRQSLATMTAKFESLVTKINMNYNITNISTKYLDGIDLQYNAYQKILYIKEISRVIYVDTFLYYLKEILKTLYAIPSRMLVIEAPYAYNRAYMYPTCKNSLNLTIADAYKEDIFCAGFSEPLVTDILRNPNKQPYLIVLDRSGWEKPFIRGKGVEVYYTVSDIKDMQMFNQFDHIISYNENTLHIPYVEDFDSLDMQERITQYSSMPIMKKTIDLLEGTASKVSEEVNIND